MKPTPSLSHLQEADFLHVYEPAEDTFLFLDALEAELDFLRGLRPSLCMEVGSGSGCVITFLASLLGPGNLYLATDVNPDATRATQRTGDSNAQRVHVVRTDLTAGMSERLRGKVDVLLFNPPYVVTPPSEVGSTGIAAAWAGGERGREVTDRLLDIAPTLLSPKGVFYLVAIAENDPQDMARILASHGLKWKTVLERKAGRERLSINRFSFID